MLMLIKLSLEIESIEIVSHRGLSGFNSISNYKVTWKNWVIVLAHDGLFFQAPLNFNRTIIKYQQSPIQQ